MKTTKTLFLILFLTLPSLSEELLLYVNEGKAGEASCLETCGGGKCTDEHASLWIRRYVCAAGESVRKKITLKDAKIVLEKTIEGFDTFIPKDRRRRHTLKRGMNKDFLKVINNAALFTGDECFGSCYEISIYDGKELIAAFETTGHYLYDRKNNVMYVVKNYEPETNMLRRFWDIYEENFCR